MQCSQFYFFFSSRRRHTRSYGDWSQTCALPIYIAACASGKECVSARQSHPSPGKRVKTRPLVPGARASARGLILWAPLRLAQRRDLRSLLAARRSEERRVGEEEGSVAQAGHGGG